jgi:predicted RNA binding protein YcfA (HicA-like mRNA interferase family)
MKRADLIKAIEDLGCQFVRHGGKHDWYRNPATGAAQPVPRHREINERLAKRIFACSVTGARIADTANPEQRSCHGSARVCSPRRTARLRGRPGRPFSVGSSAFRFFGFRHRPHNTSRKNDPHDSSLHCKLSALPK